ncbi:MAG: glucokinase [Actinomycetota bacterium]
MLVGIDLGGTKIQAVALDGTEVVAKKKIPTPPAGGVELPAAIAGVIEALGVTVDRVGIGAPGVIDIDSGTIVRAPNLHVDTTLPLTTAVADALGIASRDIVLDNDVNVGALAEQRLGAAAGARNALCVFVGTGVGGGLVLDGTIRRGPRGLAGEIGHMIVRDGGRRCGCGGLGHLEAYAGRRCLEDEARRLHEGGRETSLVRIAGDGRMKSSVFEKAVGEADEVAIELLDEAIEALGAALASAVALVDIELIVLGGGLAGRLGAPFAARVDAAVRARLFVASLEVPVVPAALGDLGGAMGAALLAA